MYTLLLSLQIFAVVISFVCVVLLLVQKSSMPAKLMLVTCFCSFVQNAGYLLEMRSKNISEAMISIRLEYIGASFIVTLLMIFTFKYCRMYLMNAIKWGIVLLDVLVLISVWCYEYIPLYYTGVEFVETGVTPHVVLGKGVLYVIFAVVMYCQFVACAVVSLIAAFRSEDPNMKKNYWLLFLSCFVPCLFYISAIVGMIEGYDSAPLGGAVGIIIFAFAIIIRRVFDVVETANENILMELDDAIVVLDYRRGFQEANKAAMELFPELANTPYGQLISNPVFNNLIDARPEEDVQINDRFFRVHVNDLYARNGIEHNFIGFSIVLFDVTESRKQLEKVNELRVAADSANKAKSDFLANVSHEIRTPINVVVGMSDVILRDYNEPQLLGYAQNIQNAANTLLDLINDILDFSKIESGRISLSNEQYRVDELFRDIVLVFQHKGKEKGLSFETKINKNIPRMLYGDVIRIKQILTNILTNAFKYTREGGITLRATFEMNGPETGELIISVEDTGIGIRKEELDKVFELFVRLDERLNKSVEGTGLGLNITKKLVEAMNGEIKVYSEYGKGSVFTIIIPQHVRSAQNDFIGEFSCEEIIAPRKSVGYEAPDAKVLIIDDSKTNLIVAKALLRDTKVKIVTGTSGEECLELVKKEHFDVIFLDHRMPVMDGIETFAKMNLMSHLNEATPVIMLTANAINNAKEYYMKEGFADFISKPICEESITGMLKKYLPESLIKE